jgi:hypothetical protein
MFREFYLVHTIAQFIFGGRGRSYTDDLLAWMPIAFQKTNNNRSNKMGIIPFICTANDRPTDLRKKAMYNRHQAIGSMIISGILPPALAIRTSEYAKDRVHLVVSIGRVDTEPGDRTGVCVDKRSAGFLASTVDSKWKPYPFYSLVAIFDDTAYLTLTVYDTGFETVPGIHGWTEQTSSPLCSLL